MLASLPSPVTLSAAPTPSPPESPAPSLLPTSPPHDAGHGPLMPTEDTHTHQAHSNLLAKAVQMLHLMPTDLSFDADAVTSGN